VWAKYQFEKNVCTEAAFTSVFGECCRKFDDPELWSIEMFTDELIGDLTNAFPCDDLDYDGWLLELRGADKVKVEPAEDITIDITPNLPAASSSMVANDDAAENILPSEDLAQLEDDDQAKCLETEQSTDNAISKSSDFLADKEDAIPTLLSQDDLSQPVAESDVHSVWHVSALQDDIEHLQSMAWRLCWDIASAHSCGNALKPANENSSQFGYRLSGPVADAHGVALFLASLTDETICQTGANFISKLLIGSSESATPVFDDEQTLTVFRLIRILRRLRELQCKSAASTVPVNEG
jgi:hypothetical protein